MVCHLAPKRSLNPLEYECLRKLTSHDANTARKQASKQEFIEDTNKKKGSG